MRAHDHARYAETALGGLLLDESTLDRPRLVDRAQALECPYLPAMKGGHRHQAGENRLVIEQHCAGAALTETTAKLGAVQLQLVAQHVKQRSGRVHIDLMRAVVDDKRNHVGTSSPRLREASLPLALHFPELAFHVAPGCSFSDIGAQEPHE